MSLRIIGCGNLDRGDDAAGLHVARRLRALGVETVEQSGESTSLMDCWTGFEHVILVDATAPHGRPGRISVWNAHVGKLPADVLACSTHAFGVRAAVEVARAMSRLPESLFIYGIEGKQFALGSPLSLEVTRAVASVVQQLLERTQLYQSGASETGWLPPGLPR
jgi:hydrogenase maturation protease